MRTGILYILLATLAFGVMNLTAKELGDLHPMQIVGFRALGSFLLLCPYMLLRGVPMLGQRPGWLVLRGLVGTISLASFFFALQRVPLGSAISIRYLGPVFAALLARWWLRERVYFWQWICFAIAFSGVMFLKGFDLRIDTLSLMLLLLSAFTVGIVFVLLRFLGQREHHLTIIYYFMVVSIVTSLLFVSSWRMPQGEEWRSVIGIGIYGLIGQVFMTKAYKLEETNVIAPFKYMELAWGLIFGYFFFTEVYNGLALIGMGLILLGMVGNVWVKQYVGKGKPQELSN